MGTIPPPAQDEQHASCADGQDLTATTKSEARSDLTTGPVAPVGGVDVSAAIAHAIVTSPPHNSAPFVTMPTGWATLVDIGGPCPVQGYGRVGRTGGAERSWYFRARHGCWSLDVGEPHADIEAYVPDESAEWSATGEDFSDGFASNDAALAAITVLLRAYLLGRLPDGVELAYAAELLGGAVADPMVDGRLPEGLRARYATVPRRRTDLVRDALEEVDRLGLSDDLLDLEILEGVPDRVTVLVHDRAAERLLYLGAAVSAWSQPCDETEPTTRDVVLDIGGGSSIRTVQALPAAVVGGAA